MQDLSYGLLSLRSLDGKLVPVVALVAYDHIIVFCLLVNPFVVLINVCRIYGHEIPIGLNLADARVVNGSPVRIAHHAIHDVTGLHLPHVVCEDMVYKFLGLSSADYYLSHVGDVEHSDMFADSVMFFDNTGVLYRHVEPAEWLHKSSESHMPVV